MTCPKSYCQYITKLGLGNEQINILWCHYCASTFSYTVLATIAEVHSLAVHIRNKKQDSMSYDLVNYLSLVMDINQCLVITSTLQCQ